MRVACWWSVTAGSLLAIVSMMLSIPWVMLHCLLLNLLSGGLVHIIANVALLLILNGYWVVFLLKELPCCNTDAHLLTNDPDNLVRCWHTGSDCLDLLKKEICDRSIKATVFQFNYAFMPLPALAELIRWHYDKKINFYVFLHNTHDPSPYVSLGQIADSLALASRILVHSIEDLNRLKMHGLVNNVTLFPSWGLSCFAGVAQWFAGCFGYDW